MLISSFFLVIFCFTYRGLQPFLSVIYTNHVKLVIFAQAAHFIFLNSPILTLISLLLKLSLNFFGEVGLIADFYSLILLFNPFNRFDDPMLMFGFSPILQPTNYHWLHTDQYLSVIFLYVEVKLLSFLIFIRVRLAY